MLARPVDHIDIADVAAFAPDQRRQEAVQAVEIGQRQPNIARERLQPAAGVARAVAEDRAAHGVGEARLESLEARGLAPDALAGDEAHRGAPCSSRPRSAREKRRIVLAVAVERDDDRRARRPHPVRSAADLPAGARVSEPGEARDACALQRVSSASVPSVEPSLT